MIASGTFVVHRPSGLVRRVCGVRDGVAHFSQCIKTPSGKTEYWADVTDLRPLNALELIRSVS